MEGKERNEKGGIGKGGVALAPRKKSQRAPTLQFITKLVIDGKLLIEMGSSFQISLRLYLIFLLQKNLTQN